MGLAEARGGDGGMPFEEAVRKYSTDPTTKANGGRLNNVTQGQGEKAFDKAVFSADKAKVYGPVNLGLLFALTEFIVAWAIAFVYSRKANAEFVEAFEKKFNRIPSQYAAQSYEAALLLDSAIARVNGKVVESIR